MYKTKCKTEMHKIIYLVNWIVEEHIASVMIMLEILASSDCN